MSTTTYPHLSTLVAVLETLDVPVTAYASLDAVANQTAPAIYLVPEECEILQTIGDNRRIQALRCRQLWTIHVVLRDASDQFATSTLLTSLGEWQANILNLLCARVLTSGGPLQLLDIPKPAVYSGGVVVGAIRLGSQFQFSAE